MTRKHRIPVAALILASGFLSGTACAETPTAPAAAAPKAAAESETKTVESSATTAAAPADTKPATASTTKPEAKLTPEELAAKETRRKIDRMTLEKLRMETEMQIADLKVRASRLTDEDERARIEAAAALRSAKTALANTKEDIVRADRDRALAIANAKAAIARQQESAAAAELETAAKLAKQESDNALLKLASAAAKVRLENEASRFADKQPAKLANPVQDGVLHISDRRILLNGLISDATAAGVITKLNFFSLADAKAPIFIVMETVPGGNAMAAYQVMKAIESCPAPVHVVVRGTVGGAAAAIAAAAPHSYTLQNSRVIFQQPASASRATTLASQADVLRVAESWYARLHAAVAAKEGKTTSEFASEIYKHNSTGDWMEFGDKAVERKWVNTLVDRIVEDSVNTLPPVAAPSSGLQPAPRRVGEARTDTSGRAYLELPPLAHGDLWMMYDPQHIYRSAN